MIFLFLYIHISWYYEQAQYLKNGFSSTSLNHKIVPEIQKSKEEPVSSKNVLLKVKEAFRNV